METSTTHIVTFVTLLLFDRFDIKKTGSNKANSIHNFNIQGAPDISQRPPNYKSIAFFIPVHLIIEYRIDPC